MWIRKLCRCHTQLTFGQEKALYRYYIVINSFGIVLFPLFLVLLNLARTSIIEKGCKDLCSFSDMLFQKGFGVSDKDIKLFLEVQRSFPDSRNEVAPFFPSLLSSFFPDRHHLIHALWHSSSKDLQCPAFPEALSIITKCKRMRTKRSVEKIHHLLSKNKEIAAFYSPIIIPICLFLYFYDHKFLPTLYLVTYVLTMYFFVCQDHLVMRCFNIRCDGYLKYFTEDFYDNFC